MSGSRSGNPHASPIAMLETSLWCRDFLLIALTFSITILCVVELVSVLTMRTSSTPMLSPLMSATAMAFSASKITPYNIAIGIFSVHRPNGPDYVYLEVMSILDTLLDSPYINFDKIHVFDGSFSGSQVKYFKYSPHVVVHPMDAEAFKMVERYPVHRKASLNYMLALQYLVPTYADKVDAVLMLEDDVLFDPNAAHLIWEILNSASQHKLFLVDGYVKGGNPGFAKETGEHIVVPFHGDARCCSQAFLLSPQVARESIDVGKTAMTTLFPWSKHWSAIAVMSSLNGSEVYMPLDVFLTTSWLKRSDFHFFFSATCFVQHIGYPALGLGKPCT